MEHSDGGYRSGRQPRLLALLRDEGPMSRVALGERLELPRAKLGGALTRLLDAGLVEIGGPAASRGGRRSMLVHLADDLRFLAVDVGATSVDVAVTDGRCEVLAGQSEDCDVRQGPDHVLSRVVDLAAVVLAKTPGRLMAAGIGLPGPVSFRDGMPVAPPIMPGWDRYPVRDELAGRWGCPVTVDNDVNVMALGERHAGVARSLDDLVFVKVGTGIGCGIVLGGVVYRGVEGTAGDIGHIRLDDYGPACACGEVGCLEAYFGGAALSRDALTLARSGRSPMLAEMLTARTTSTTDGSDPSGAGAPGSAGATARPGATGGAARSPRPGDAPRPPVPTLTAEDVGIAAAAGDVAATNLVREGGRRLGHVIASLVSFLNPGMVVIGGGVSRLGHPLLAEVRGSVYRRSLPLATGNLPIVLSELGSMAGVTGASWSATERIFTTAG